MKPFHFVALIAFALPAHGQALNVYFGNLHSHSSYSDGAGTPEEAYIHARDVAHIDLLAVTDHNHASAPSKLGRHPELYSDESDPDSLMGTAHRLTQDGRFVAIVGQEYSSLSSGNHGNVFEIKEVIDEKQVPNGQWNVLMDWLKSRPDSMGKPAIMLLNHPGTASSPNEKEYGRDDYGTDVGKWREALEAHATLINLINGPSHQGTTAGDPSEREFLRYLNLGLHVAPTADQDNHRANWGDAAPPRTGIIAATLTKADVLDAMRARHVYATQDPNLRIIGRVNGELMGTRFTGNRVPAPGTELSIELEIKDDNEPHAEYRFEVYGDAVGGPKEADVVATHKVTGNGRVHIPGVTYTGGDQYFFVKVTQSDDDSEEVDQAWLAPVWFEPSVTQPGANPATPVGPKPGLIVDLLEERATLTNVGDQELHLGGWTLVSVQGDQKFKFPDGTKLAAGESISVLSGAAARQPTAADLVWDKNPVWRNSGDPARLLDEQGGLRAEYPSAD